MWFHQVPDARVLVRTKQGVFMQRDVFRGPHNRLFFQHGSGFVRIGAGDATSAPTLSVVALDLPFTPERDDLRSPLYSSSNSQPYNVEVVK